MPADKPCVTIIVPVFNGARTLDETLSSVFLQTFEDFELVIINDGSTDSTPEIIGSFQDTRLRIHSQSNRGLSASRNQGVQMARGQYLAFLDADDLWHPEKLERQVTLLNANPEAAAVYAWSDLIDGDGYLIAAGSRSSKSGWIWGELVRQNFIESGSNLLVRKAVLEICGDFDVSLQAAEDWDLWLRIARGHPILNLPEALIFYRVHPHSMSSSDVRRQERCLRTVVERALKEAPDRTELRLQSLSGIFQYLAQRAVTPPIRRNNAVLALRYLFKAFWLSPSLFLSYRPLTVILSKVLVGLVSPGWVQSLILKSVQLSRTKPYEKLQARSNSSSIMRTS